jgi:hypothetical protein
MIGFGSQAFTSCVHLCPRDPIPLASTPQRVPPKVSDVMPEHRQCAAVIGPHGPRCSNCRNVVNIVVDRRTVPSAC